MLNASAKMREMIVAGHWARMIQLAAQLDLGALLASGPRHTLDLATVTGTDPDSLSRLLGALASKEIVVAERDGFWNLTPLGETLRGDAAGSCQQAALYWGLPSVRGAWDALEYSIRTGQPGFAHANNRGFFDHMEHNAADGRVFDAFIAHPDRSAAHAEAIDWSRFRQVVDVGGGTGAFLQEILARNPNIVGTLLDVPRAVEQAHAVERGGNLTARFRALAGDFFTSVPAGADAYILSQILHDWPNEASLAILRACRAAMPQHGKMLVIEQLMGEGPDPSFVSRGDVAMLVLLGGRERSRTEFQSLFAAANLALESVTTLPSSFFLLTAGVIC